MCAANPNNMEKKKQICSKHIGIIYKISQTIFLTNYKNDTTYPSKLLYSNLNLFQIV